MAQNVTYPFRARKSKITGKVTYKFDIDTLGHIEDVKIEKDIGGGCGHAVKRVIERYPDTWIPARTDFGQPLKSWFRGSFNFTLD